MKWTEIGLHQFSSASSCSSIHSRPGLCSSVHGQVWIGDHFDAHIRRCFIIMCCLICLCALFAWPACLCSCATWLVWNLTMSPMLAFGKLTSRRRQRAGAATAEERCHRHRPRRMCHSSLGCRIKDLE